MLINDYTDKGLLQRWYLLNGVARCPFDAIQTVRLSRDDLAAVLAANQVVRDAITVVEAYEAAQTVLLQPLGTAPTDKTSPAYADYQARKERRAAAQAIVAAASEETQELAQRRTGLDAQGDFYADDPLPTPAELLPDPGVIPAKISSRQFFWALYKRKFINKDEAMAAIKAGTTPPLVATILGGIPVQDVRDDLEALIMGAMDIERANPSTQMFGGAVGMTKEEIDLFFAFAITL